MRHEVLFLIAALAVSCPAAATQPAAPAPQGNAPSPYCGPLLAVARAAPLCLCETAVKMPGTPHTEFAPYIQRPNDPGVPLESHVYVLTGWSADMPDRLEMQATSVHSIAPSSAGGYVGGNLLSYHLRSQGLGGYSGVGLHFVTGVWLSQSRYLKLDYSHLWNQGGSVGLKSPSPAVSLGFRY
jgi:hypothetical protein